MSVDEFKKLYDVFKTNGFSLYLVGGTVRDYLLDKELLDMDAVTDAKPDTMKLFLKDADYTFARFGSVSYKTASGLKASSLAQSSDRVLRLSAAVNLKLFSAFSTKVERRKGIIGAI